MTCPECDGERMHPVTRTEIFDFDAGEQGVVRVTAKVVPVDTCDDCGCVMSGPDAARVRKAAILAAGVEL
jgi:transposase